MPEEEHIEIALRYAPVQEALQTLDASQRTAIVHALSVAIREARHEERLRCAKIALDEVQAATARGEQLCQAVADGIAAAIVERDTEAE